VTEGREEIVPEERGDGRIAFSRPQLLQHDRHIPLKLLNRIFSCFFLLRLLLL
jgi:hypothetical protein